MLYKQLSFFCWLQMSCMIPLIAQVDWMQQRYNSAADNKNLLQRIDTLNQLIREVPNFAWAHYLKGRTYEQLGKQDDAALKSLTKAMELATNPNLISNILQIRSRLLIKMKQYDAAIQDLTKLPKDTLIYYALGLAHEGQGQVDAAQKDYEQALRLNPKFTLAKERLDQVVKPLEIEITQPIMLANQVYETDLDQIVLHFGLSNKQPSTYESERSSTRGTRGSAVRRKSELLQAQHVLELKLFEGINILTLTLKDVNGRIAQQIFKFLYIPPRLALVIGNQNYNVDARLQNPQNDADSMEMVLKSARFKVEKHHNLTKEQMEKKVHDLVQEGSKYKTILFYFAGHGCEKQGVPQLKGIETNKNEDNLFSLKYIANLMRPLERDTGRLFILLLDACRDNEDTKMVASDGYATKNMIISLGALSGKSAGDECGTNGCYTRCLLDCIREPKLDIQQMLANVRGCLEKKSHDQQISPTVNTMMGKRIFYFFE
jgi:predicted nucleic acid-binding protein